MNLSKIIFFFVFGFALTTNLTTQEIKERKSAADSLLQFVKEITPEKVGESFEINDEELEQARKLLYNAYAYAPLELKKQLHKWTEQWRSTGIKGVKPPIGIKPTARLKRVKSKLAEKYGWEYVRFLETPYFMKVVVKDITYLTYSIKRGNRNIKLHKVNLKAKILDVIKGKAFYSVNETIIVSYLPFWFYESSLPEFKVGSIYAFPLKHWPNEKKVEENELMLKLNGLHTLYEVKNDIVYSPLAPDKSPLKSWKTFKYEFGKNFLIEE